MQQEPVQPGSPGYVDPAAYKLIVAAQMAAIEAALRQMAAQQAAD